MAARPKAFWPLVIDAVNGAIPGYGTVAAGTYYSAAEFLAAVQAALGAGYFVTTNSQGRVTISHPGGVFTLLFGGAPPIAALLGFGAGDLAGEMSYTGPYQHANGWYGDRSIGADPGPEFDSASASAVSLFGVVSTLIWPDRELRTLTFSMVPSHKTKIAFEDSAHSLDGIDHANEAIERLWREGRPRFRYWPNAVDEVTHVDLCFHDDALRSFKPTRHARKALFSWTWSLRRYVEG